VLERVVKNKEPSEQSNTNSNNKKQEETKTNVPA